MNDQILLIGGANSPGDLWLASDPNHWTLLTASAQFSARHGHACVQLNGEVLVIGGYTYLLSNSNPANDVWAANTTSTRCCCCA